MPHLSTPRRLLKLLRDERAATAIEYGLVVATIALGVAGTMSAMGHSLADVFNTLSANLTSAR